LTRRTLRRPACFVAVFLLLFSAGAAAREVTVAAVDGDLDLPLEGALIRLPDGGEIHCDEEGLAALEIPDGEDVWIQIIYPGYRSERFQLRPPADFYTLGLHIGEVSESEAEEIIIRAARPGTGQTRTGRSLGLGQEEITATGESGIIEDVMSAVKLLPGVGYTNSFNALPSIRGGEPGDLTAVFDGFYIDQPYHWAGVASIFDPRMIRSVQLSHGVFSARYGQTISGLLEVSSRRADDEGFKAEAGISTSAFNFNMSLPWGQRNNKAPSTDGENSASVDSPASPSFPRGGIVVQGKITYWDPFVWFAKKYVEEMNYINKAPYIRSGAVSAFHRFNPDTELTVNGYFGADGMDAYYDEGTPATPENTFYEWRNKLGFLTAGLSSSPRRDLILKTQVGLGFPPRIFWG
jgi:hypothetical protein